MSPCAAGYPPPVGSVSHEALLEAIVDASGDAVLSHDAALTIMSWDRTAERFFGYAAAEVVGHPSLSL